MRCIPNKRREPRGIVCPDHRRRAAFPHLCKTRTELFCGSVISKRGVHIVMRNPPTASMGPKDRVLKATVSRIRRQFESGKVPQLLLALEYSRYNPISDVTRFISSAGEMFPKLNCGIASTYLRGELGAGQIVTGSYNGEKHTFLLLDGRVVVDITADQFGGPSVYIGALRKPWSLLPPGDN